MKDWGLGIDIPPLLPQARILSNIVLGFSRGTEPMKWKRCGGKMERNQGGGGAGVKRGRGGEEGRRKGVQSVNSEVM